MPQFKAIILDLRNVVFEWDSNSKLLAGETNRPLLKSIMTSDVWYQFDCGRITTAECYKALGDLLGIQSSEIRTILQDARATLQANRPLLNFIRELKKTTGVAVYALCNIPREEIDYLQSAMPAEMSVFDKIFASGYVGMRKPDLGMYRLVMRETKLLPRQLIFVDSKAVNVGSAQCLGIHGIRFRGTEQLYEDLRSLLLPNSLYPIQEKL